MPKYRKVLHKVRPDWRIGLALSFPADISEGVAIARFKDKMGQEPDILERDGVDWVATLYLSPLPGLQGIENLKDETAS